MLQERRRHPRLEIPLETDLRLAGGAAEISATMQDLSAGGAGLLTTFEIPVDTEVERLAFELPDRRGDEATTIQVAARVARCEQQSGVGGEAEFLVGVQFVDIDREVFDRIQQFVFKRMRSTQKERVQIERPIAIRFDRFDDFVDEVSVNLSASGMFIRTRDPRPPGSVFNFQFQLGEDFSLIDGRAEVVWRRRHTEGPDKLPGMGVKFLNLDVPSQRLIKRLISQRQEAEGADEEAVDAAAGVEEATAESPPAAAEAPAGAPQPDAADEDEVEIVPERTGRATPPDLQHAEASVLGLGQVNALRDEAARLTDELETARREHQQDLQQLRARLEDRHAAARSELEERLRDAEAAHKESERRRGELAGELETATQEAEEARRQAEEAARPEELERLRGERDELAAARGERERELEASRTEATDLRRQLEARPSAAEVEELTGETTRLRTARDELGEAHAALEQELEKARGEADELRGQLDERTPEEEVQRLATERDALQATHDRLLADLDRANGEADEVRRQLEDRTAEKELERLAAERADLETAYQDLQSAGDELRAEAGRARDEAEALRGRLAAGLSPEEAQRLAGERDSLQATNERLLGDLDRANGEADEIRRELDEQRRGENDLRARLEELEGELAGARQELQEVHGELEQGRRGHEAALAQTATDHQAVLEKTVAEARQEAAARLAELEAAAETSRQTVEREAQEAARQTAEEIAGLRQDLAAAGERNDTLEDELGSLGQELTAARQRGETLESELDSLRQELDRAAASEGAAEALAETRAEADRLHGELAGAQEQRARAESEIQRLRGDARQAARHAEEREMALRADAENAVLTATGGMAPPEVEAGSRRRPLVGAALLALGLLLGGLAVTFIEPLGSLAGRLRPGGQPDVLAELPSPTASAPEPTAPGTTEPGATAEPPPPEPQPEPGPDPAEAERAVLAWAAAWSEQRVDDYLAAYADSYQPPDGQSRDAWAATRRQRIARPRSIQVDVEAPRTVELGADRVSVSFDQAYTSDTYADRVRKTLVMVWQDDRWKVAEERVIE